MSRTALLVTTLLLAATGVMVMNVLTDKSSPGAEETSVIPESGNRWSVAVTATDKSFDILLDALPSGMAAIDLVGGGSSPHELQIFRLSEGVAFKRFAALARRLGRDPELFELATPVGGAGAGGGVAPGSSQRIVVDLDLGTYAFVSFFNDDHENGFIRRFAIVEGEEVPAGIPSTTGNVTMEDRSFVVDPQTLTTGAVKVENVDDEVHEAAIFSLEDSSLEELVEGLESDTDASGATGFGILAPDRLTYSQLDLPPGDYAFICRLTDTATGRPHYQDGMAAEFEVQ